MIDDKSQFITIANFTDAIEANIIRGRLEAEGINVHIADQHYITMNWFLSNALGGVKLQVSPNDIAKAQLILNDLSEGKFEIQEDNSSEIVCPKCGSNHITHLKPQKGLILLILWLFNFPMPYSSRKYQCHDCKNQWTLI